MKEKAAIAQADQHAAPCQSAPLPGHTHPLRIGAGHTVRAAGLQGGRAYVPDRAYIAHEGIFSCVCCWKTGQPFVHTAQ